MSGRIERRRGRGIPRTLALYASGFLVGWAVLNLSLYWLKTSGARPVPWGTLGQKMSAFREDPERFDLVFVGDSRTYCAMHPDLLDEPLGRRSINLAHWANWFPTQYAQLQDLLPVLSPDTVVVWSVGHQNFRPINSRVHTAYPVGLRNVPDYLRLGYTLDSLRDNLVFHNPFTTVLGWMPQLRQTLETRLDRPLADPADEGSTDPALSAAARRAVERPGVARWELRTEAGRPTSVELYKDNGAYGRVEIDREFFRRKQRENAAELVEHARGEPAEYVPAPEYWAMFLQTLELFRQYDVKLVVNEIEEAPYVYLNDERRDRFRRFMREVVEPEVTTRGGSYVRIDFEQLSDADYFDYNHLNTRGVARFSELLIERLRPALL